MQPPQDPLNLNKPSPYEPPSSVPAPRPGRGVSLDVIGEAWTLLKPNIGPWIGAVLIVTVIQLIFGALQGAVTPRNAQGVQQLSALSVLMQIIGSIVGIFLTGALFKMAIQHVRTGRAEIGEMFNIGDVVGSLLIASILVGLVTIAGLIACIIPGIIAALGLSMTSLLVVDQKLGATEAMGRSWAALKGQLGAYFVLGLVLVLLNLAGLLACGVGVIVTSALTQIAIALVYRDLFLGGTTPSVGPIIPNAPIADPRG